MGIAEQTLIVLAVMAVLFVTEIIQMCIRDRFTPGTPTGDIVKFINENVK